MVMSYYGTERNGIYRSRRGVVAGVCRGIADYLDISVFWTRVVTLATLLCTGFFPTLFLYLLAILLMKKEPRIRWS
jgi:phage shock protein C